MKTLLWKDIRLNSMIIVYALITTVGLFFAMAVVNKIVEWRTGFCIQSWSMLFGSAALLSLILQLVTITLLGACAFAPERADRTAEFMAYMPVSRGQVILSKIILSLMIFAFIGLWDIGTVYLVDSGKGVENGNSFSKVALMFSSMSLCIFSCSWFVSTMSQSHGLAAAVGILVPIGCIGILLTITHLMGWSEDWLNHGMPIMLLSLGFVGFTAGVRYYLWRVEP